MYGISFLLSDYFLLETAEFCDIVTFKSKTLSEQYNDSNRDNIGNPELKDIKGIRRYQMVRQKSLSRKTDKNETKDKHITHNTILKNKAGVTRTDTPKFVSFHGFQMEIEKK